jgi:hypothetical protein
MKVRKRPLPRPGVDGRISQSEAPCWGAVDNLTRRTCSRFLCQTKTSHGTPCSGLACHGYSVLTPRAWPTELSCGSWRCGWWKFSARRTLNNVRNSRGRLFHGLLGWLVASSAETPFYVGLSGMRLTERLEQPCPLRDEFLITLVVKVRLSYET